MTYKMISIDPITLEIKDVVNPISLSLHFQFPQGDFWTSKVSELASISSNQPMTKFPLPEMSSAIKGLFPFSSDENKRKEAFVQTFVKFVEVSKQSEDGYCVK